MDITDFITFFVNSIKDIVAYCFTWLDSITFMGTSLLRYSIGLIILSMVIEIMLTLVKTRSIKESRPGTKKEVAKKE